MENIHVTKEQLQDLIDTADIKICNIDEVLKEHKEKMEELKKPFLEKIAFLQAQAALVEKQMYEAIEKPLEYQITLEDVKQKLQAALPGWEALKETLGWEDLDVDPYEEMTVTETVTTTTTRTVKMVRKGKKDATVFTRGGLQDAILSILKDEGKPLSAPDMGSRLYQRYGARPSVTSVLTTMNRMFQRDILDMSMGRFRLHK